MKKVFYSLIVLLQGITISHAQIDLLKDIKPGMKVPELGPALAYKGFIYYQGMSESSGAELWRTDGTPEGTNLVKDIFPGSANQSFPDNFIVLNDILYFTAADSSGRELWRTDGTAQGTMMVADINGGGESSNPEHLTIFNGKLFFHATDAPHGTEVWMTDGSAGNTTLLIDANPGTNGSVASLNTRTVILPYKDYLYFSVINSTSGVELWKTNGSTDGTTMVKRVDAISSDVITFMVTVNLKLLFGVKDPRGPGFRLWVSDGTSANTEPMGDFTVSGAGEMYPMQDQIMGNYLFFSGTSGITTTGNYELWKTDGTEAHTQLVADVNGSSDVGSLPINLLAIGSTLYFDARSTPDYTSKHNLYKTNGEPGNYMLVSDDFQAGYPAMNLTNYNGMLTFAGRSKFYWYDGSIVHSVDAGMAGNPVANFFTELNDVLYFSPTGLWKFDGTTASMVGEGKMQDNSSNPSWFTDGGNGVVYFAADDGVNGKELWRSSGPGDASMVKDINPSGASGPTNLSMYNGKLYFTANNGSSQDPQIWKSDGTGPGTTMILGPQQVNYQGIPQSSIIHAGALFIAAYDGLWKIEGDALPVRIVTSYVTPKTLTSTDTYLYFVGYNTTTFGCSLYKSDGTAAGTSPVADNISGCMGPTDSPEDIIEFKSKIYFDGNSATGQSELWSYDGTAASVVNAYTDGGPANVGNFSVVGDVLFFGGDDTAHGYELWKTDGTATNTVMVKDIKAGTESGLFTGPGHGPPISMIFQHINFNNKLYFAADDGTHGRELWVSDGTDLGTVMLNDLAPGSTAGSPSNFVVLDSVLYFLGADEYVQQYPNNVYVTNGLSCGTREIKSSLYETSAARNLTAVGNKLFVSLKDTKIGQETFIIDPSRVAPPPSGCGASLNPLTQPSTLVFSEVKSESMTISFTPSSTPPAGYIILMRSGQSPYPENVPVNGTAYNQGDKIGSSTVAGVGDQTTWQIQQLTPETTYYFDVFSFDASHQYLTVNPLAGNQRTGSVDPGIAAISFPVVTESKITVSFTPTEPANGYMTLMKALSPSTDMPKDGNVYEVGSSVGNSLVVGFGSDTVINVTALQPSTEYYFIVYPFLQSGDHYDYVTEKSIAARQQTTGMTTGVAASKEDRPAYPNPFTDVLTIPFYVAADNSTVRVVIYDHVGRVIADLEHTTFESGNHEVSWDRTDTQGNKVQAGMYVYQIRASGKDGVVQGLVVAK